MNDILIINLKWHFLCGKNSIIVLEKVKFHVAKQQLCLGIKYQHDGL